MTDDLLREFIKKNIKAATDWYYHYLSDNSKKAMFHLGIKNGYSEVLDFIDREDNKIESETEQPASRLERQLKVTSDLIDCLSAYKGVLEDYSEEEE